GQAAYYIGTISEVAYYRNALSQQTVTAQYQASKTANTLITDGGATPVETVNVTDPGGKRASGSRRSEYARICGAVLAPARRCLASQARGHFVYHRQVNLRAGPLRIRFVVSG